MQQALRPYVTSGIAVVGASALLAAPVASPPTLPGLSSMHVSAVQLTAGLELGQLVDLGDLGNPIDVYTSLVTNSFGNLSGIGQHFLDEPFPILQAVASNQIGYIQGVFQEPASIFGVPGQMLGNLANVYTALTTLSPDIVLHSDLLDNVTGLLDYINGLDLGNLLTPLTTLEHIVSEVAGILGDITSGSPLAILDIDLPPAVVLGLATLGPLVNSADAFSTTVGTLGSELSGGNYLPALATLISSPGFVLNAALNGEWGASLDLGAVGGANIPLLNGLLVPFQDAQPGLLNDLLQINVGPLSGLTDGLVNYLPQQIADALLEGGASGALPGLGDLFSGLPLDLASFADLGNFLNFGDLLGDFGLGSLGSGLPVELVTALLDPSLILGALGL